MKDAVKYASVSVLALMLAAPAIAQGALVGTEALDERIENIETDARDDLARGEDDERFDPLGVPQGWRGSIALLGSATSGNTDSGELSIAGRLTYGAGPWSQTFGLAGEFGESNGVRNEEKFFAIYEGNRYFTEQFYAFGLARFEYDGIAAAAAPGVAPANERDAFIGFGPGYRVINTDQMTWRVQAGPGWRRVERSDGTAETEGGFIASSRFYYGLSETVSLTNDTDVLGSDINTLSTNDFGVNFKMSDTLSTRLSYRTEYNSDPGLGRKKTDNTVGVSLIVGF